jgi:hypothetical protein
MNWRLLASIDRWRSGVCLEVGGPATLRRGQRAPAGGAKLLGGMPVANRYLFTSESVTEGHPDKIAD